MDRTLYECDWGQPQRDLKLAELAARYCDTTEAYDRTVCSGPIVEGAIQPATDRERALIARFARQTLSQVLEEAQQAGFTRTELNHAIALHDRRGPGA